MLALPRQGQQVCANGKNLNHALDGHHALESAEALYRRLVNASGQLAFSLKLRPRLVLHHISPSAERLLGHPIQTYYDEPARLLTQLYPRDRSILKRAFIARTTNPVLRFIRADGNLICMEATLLIERDARGRALVAEGLLRDVTYQTLDSELQQDRLSISEAERRWVQTILAQLPVGMILVRNRGGRLKVTINERMRQMFPNFSEEDHENWHSHRNVLSPNGTPVDVEQLPSSRALRGEILRDEEFRIRNYRDRHLPVAVSASPIYGTQGQVVGAVVSVEDISERKELERLRGEWSQVIAHDLRQPISTILLFGSLLEESPEVPANLRKGAGFVRDAARQLHRMVEDLTDASRLEVRSLRLDKQVLDLGVLLREIIEVMQAEQPEHPIHHRIAQDLPPVEADPGRMRQVFVNLISNALKYGYSDAPVTVSARPGPAGTVCVAVVNEGEGLRENEIAQLFQRFGRTPKAAASPIRGTGLGLYLTKGLVEAHGGEIRVESVPGRQTVFSVLLPVPDHDKEE